MKPKKLKKCTCAGFKKTVAVRVGMERKLSNEEVRWMER